MWSSWVSPVISVTYLFTPFTIMTQEQVPSPNSCSHGSILSLWMMSCLEVSCTLDMSSHFVQFRIVEGREIQSLRHGLCDALHWSTVWSIEDDLEDLRIFVRNRAASFLARCHWSEAFCSLSTILLASPWSPNCSEQQVSLYLWTTRDSPGPLPLPWTLSWLTEMIVRRTTSAVSSSQQKCIDNFPFPLALKISSFQGTGSAKHGMSAFHENLSSWSQRQCPILRSVCSYVFLLLIQAQETTNVRANLLAYSVTMLELAIHNSSFPYSLHIMSLYIDMKMIRPWNCSGSL